MAINIYNVKTFRVDLKWSCWTVWDDERWDGAFEFMQGLLPGTAVTIRTAPRKEIRYGRVIVSRLFPSMWIAEGVFTCGWDDPEDLACSMAADCIGVDNEFSVKANTFERLMRRIDAEENRCMSMSNEQWDEIECCFNKTRADQT
jgi:hypothetical protein